MLERLVLRTLKQKEKNLKKTKQNKKNTVRHGDQFFLFVLLILIFNLWLRENFFFKGKLSEKYLVSNIFSILVLSNYYKF